jgi:hypothetical protein
MSGGISNSLIPLLVGNNSNITAQKASRTTGGQTVSTVQITNALAFGSSAIETTFRVPDYFGRGKLSTLSNVNVYLAASGVGVSVDVYLPLGRNTSTQMIVQNAKPERILTNYSMPGVQFALVCSGALIGCLVTVIWKGTFATNAAVGEIYFSVPTLQFEDILTYAPKCSLPLLADESYSNSGYSCVLQLNRIFTQGQLGIIQLKSKIIYAGGTYTIGSSDSNLVDSSSGQISSGASIIIYVNVKSSSTTARQLTLTMTIPNIGNETYFMLIPGSL